MALELNGTTGVSLVQDGVVTAADLNSTLDLSGKTVTLPNDARGVIQSVYSKLNGTPSFNTGQDVWANVGFTVSITPTSTSSKLFFSVSFVAYHASSSIDSNFRVLLNDGYFNQNTSPVSGSSPCAILGNLRGDFESIQGLRYTYTTVVEPNSTSQQTFKLQATTEGASLVMNRGQQGGLIRFGSPAAEMFVLEVLA